MNRASMRGRCRLDDRPIKTALAVSLHGVSWRRLPSQMGFSEEAPTIATKYRARQHNILFRHEDDKFVTMLHVVKDRQGGKRQNDEPRLLCTVY